jgi:hypothetical protein
MEEDSVEYGIIYGRLIISINNPVVNYLPLIFYPYGVW